MKIDKPITYRGYKWLKEIQNRESPFDISLIGYLNALKFLADVEYEYGVWWDNYNSITKVNIANQVWNKYNNK